MAVFKQVQWIKTILFFFLIFGACDVHRISSTVNNSLSLGYYNRTKFKHVEYKNLTSLASQKSTENQQSIPIPSVTSRARNLQFSNAFKQQQDENLLIEELNLIFEPERSLEQSYPNNKFLDPCKANAFFGDIALSDEERDNILFQNGHVDASPIQMWAEEKNAESSKENRINSKNPTHKPFSEEWQFPVNSEHSHRTFSRSTNVKRVQPMDKNINAIHPLLDHPSNNPETKYVNQYNNFPNHQQPLHLKNPQQSALSINNSLSHVSSLPFLEKANNISSIRQHRRLHQIPANHVPIYKVGQAKRLQQKRRVKQRDMKRLLRLRIRNPDKLDSSTSRAGKPNKSKQFSKAAYDQLLRKHRKLRRRQKRLIRQVDALSRQQQYLLQTSKFGADNKLGSVDLNADRPNSRNSNVRENYQRNKNLNVQDGGRRRSKRAATAYKSRTWPYGVIPYIVQANFSSETKATIMKAMQHWENHTCLSFVKREPHHKSYIIFTVKACGCCSYVGRRSEDEPQAISIGKNCDKKGIVIHELGHVIGFWHEHTRPDRDDHVDILLENVVDGQDFNFKKMDSGEVNSLGEPYDYSSIMHYAKGTFAKANKDETIRPKACCPRPPIGQRIQLSPGDVRQTNKLYGCPACGRTLLEPSGVFASPQMSWILHNNNNYQNVPIPEIDFNSPDILTDPASFYHPLTGELTNHQQTGMVGDSSAKWKNDHTSMDSTDDQVLFSMQNYAASSLGFTSSSPLFCQWRITVAMGERIYLNFTHLDIFSPTGIRHADDVHNKNKDRSFVLSRSTTVSCANDYVEVRDGYYSGSPLIGRYCGKKVPPTLISSKSRLWIEYRRSSGSQSTGFAAEYQAICGGELVQDEGIITSPSYPNFYKPNKECIWKIVVPLGFSVALTFQSFEIEKHDNCVYDFLEIRDGLSDTSPVLKKLCGPNLPTPIKSTNNMLYVKFISDSSVEKQGFTAKFQKEFDECKTTKHGCSHICVNTLGGYRCQCEIGYELHTDGKQCEDACGGVVNAANGTIQTPGFPSDYPPSKNCIWKIVAAPKSTIFFNFTHFDLEGSNKACNYDFISVFSGPQHNQQKIGTFCGKSLPTPITSHTNELSIEFYTDGSIQKTGFKAVFFTDRDECADNNGGCQHICQNTIGAYHCKCRPGFKLYGRFNCKEIGISSGCKQDISTLEGEITTPKWPAEYPPRQNCQWRFTAPPGHRIKILFDTFEIESHQQCMYDRVIAYDGLSINMPQLGRFCGGRKPAPIISTKSNMLLTFNADSSVQRKGFRAQYSTICGGELEATLTPQNLYSHAKFGDLHYPVNQQCYWTINASLKNYTILVQFLFFEVEEENLCTYDFVKLVDGSDATSQRLGQYCGHKLPPDVYAESGSLHLQFETDDTINGKGFHAQYLLVPYNAVAHKSRVESNNLVKTASSNSFFPGTHFSKPTEMIQQYQPAFRRHINQPIRSPAAYNYFRYMQRSPSSTPQTRKYAYPFSSNVHSSFKPQAYSINTPLSSVSQEPYNSLYRRKRNWKTSYFSKNPNYASSVFPKAFSNHSTPLRTYKKLPYRSYISSRYSIPSTSRRHVVSDTSSLKSSPTRSSTLQSADFPFQNARHKKPVLTESQTKSYSTSYAKLKPGVEYGIHSVTKYQSPVPYFVSRTAHNRKLNRNSRMYRTYVQF